MGEERPGWRRGLEGSGKLAIKALMGLAFGALACAAAADLREPPPGGGDRTTYAGACRHYEARALETRGTPSAEFAGFLAEACATAEVLLASGTPEQRRRSALLLDRIAKLRRTVHGMNASRAAGGAGAYVPVSPSGEFLIAHRLGVLLAFDAWLDSGVEFSIASYP